MPQAVVALTQARIALDNESIVLKSPHVGKRSEVRRHLAAYALGEIRVGGFKHSPSRRLINRIYDLQTKAPNRKAGETSMRLATPPHRDRIA